MSRTMQCANVQSQGNAHSHNTPESRTNDCTLPAQNSLKAAANAVLARTLPRTVAAQSEETARTLPAQNTPECVGNVQPIPEDLERLIQRAGAYWEYSPDDYILIREVARRDPDGLRLALETDVAFNPVNSTSPAITGGNQA